MRDLPPGWATDLAVLRHSGSLIEDRGDHLIVRSPHNPGYHWGNCLFVTDEASVDDARRWIGVFHDAHPTAAWIAIGLIRMPERPEAWTAEGLDLELDDVLTTRTLPRQTPLPPGYLVRRLDGEDWDQSVARELVENERTGEHDPQSFTAFVRGQIRVRRAMSDRGSAAFFGAFTEEGALVADLGIVRCAAVARYQNVATDADHRRRGLAAHLLGVAARWAADRGCDQWVIVTEATNPAGRVYRSVGFEPDVSNAQAYRRPSRDSTVDA